MKKDRNCGGMMYPQMVPNFGGVMMPGGAVPYGGDMNMGNMMNIPGGFSSQNYNSPDLNNLMNQVNSLEQRVSRLEGTINNSSFSNNYNSSNYQMM